MLAEAREQAPNATYVQGDALALPFADGAFDRIFTAHFYGHLEDADRERFLAEARRLAPELVVVDSALREDVEPEERQERILNDGSRWEVYKRYFEPDALAAGARRRRDRLRRPLVRRRPLLTRRRTRYRSIASLQRDNRVCRACAEAGFPLESLPIVQPYDGPARVHVRAGAGHRRGRGAPPLARSRRPDAAALARARRGGVLRDLLLRVGHALLPGPGAERPRRPHADAARAGALRVLARVGAAPDPARS